MSSGWISVGAISLLAASLLGVACSDEPAEGIDPAAGGAASGGAPEPNGGKATEPPGAEAGVGGESASRGGASSPPTTAGAGGETSEAGSGGRSSVAESATCVARGTLCAKNADCNPGQRCESSQCVDGPQVCDNDEDCGYARVCLDSACVDSHLARGEPCEWSTDDPRSCAPGFRCDLFTPFAPDFYTCNRSDDGMRCCIGDEESCLSTCEHGYYCDFGGEKHPPNTCQPHGNLGDTCGYYYPGECADGLTCRWDGEDYKCLAAGAENDLCLPYYSTFWVGMVPDERLPPQCEPELRCDDEAEPTDAPFDALGRCVSGTRRRLVPLGAACSLWPSGPQPRCPEGSVCTSLTRFVEPTCVSITSLGEVCVPDIYPSTCANGLVCGQPDPNEPVYSCLQPVGFGEACNASSLCADGAVCVPD